MLSQCVLTAHLFGAAHTAEGIKVVVKRSYARPTQNPQLRASILVEGLAALSVTVMHLLDVCITVINPFDWWAGCVSGGVCESDKAD